MRQLICIVIIVFFFGNTNAQSNDGVDSSRSYWIYLHQMSKMTPDSIQSAYIYAKEDINFGFPYYRTTPYLEVIFKDNNIVCINLKKGKFKLDVDGFAYPKIRFDNGNPIRVKCIKEDDDLETLLFVKADSIIERIKKAKVVRIEAMFYDGEKRVMEFEPNQLKWPYKSKPEEKTPDNKQSSKKTKQVKSDGIADSVNFHWQYGYEIDKMTSDTIYTAYALAKELLDFKFPYDGGVTANLILCCKNDTNYLTVAIAKGQFHFDVNEVDVRIRFDNEKPLTVKCYRSTDGTSQNIWFRESADSLMAKLKKCQKILVEASFFNDGSRIMEFDAGNLVWHHGEADIKKTKKPTTGKK